MSSTQLDVTMIKPLGVGVSVAFVWALAAQMMTSIILTVFFGSTGFSRTGTLTSGDFAAIAGFTGAAVILILWGDGLRSGQQWAWGALLVLAGLLTIGGLVIIPTSLRAIGDQHFAPLWSQIILLTLPPLIVFRLVQPATRRWYRGISVTAARARHNSPLWLAAIIGSAAIGGAVTAIMQRLA